MYREVEALTGLDESRVRAAQEAISAWGLQHVSSELLANNLDAAVASTLLVEGIELLTEHGAPRASLLRKLREDRMVWSTFAEVRVASLLIEASPDSVEVALEPGRKVGAHPDFRFIMRGADRGSGVEVKAIGLSDREVAFCERMARVLPRLMPSRGIVHLHAPLSARAPWLSQEIRRRQSKLARSAADSSPSFPDGLRGSVIVGHGSGKDYARRAARRIVQAIRQMPESSDDFWVAVYWSNGAPVELIHDAVAWHEVPRNVKGLILASNA